MTKKIEAIIRLEKLNAVKNALSEIGVIGLNVLEIRGRGRGQGMQFHWRTGTYKVDLLPRVQVNIILSDENVDATVKAIVRAARSGDAGEKGDGMIFVYPVEQVIRISSGEEGRQALHYQGDIDTKKRV
ncbi:MAG: P-II family nitrogen regulator [Anaerolineae bacterium]|nr:P-II family nitrogen regulator [Anaerolineae bacterium]